MKHTVLMILITIILALGVSGCGEEALIGGAVGGAMVNTISGANADLDAQIQLELDRKAELVEQMSAVNDDAQLALMQARLDTQNETIKKLQTGKTALEIGERAIGTNWTDTAETAPWISTGVLGLMYLLQGKKTRNLAGLLKVLNQGVNTHMAKTTPEEAEKLRSRINSYVAGPVMQ